MSCIQCPASMCPLIAKDGSPWTGTKVSPCPEQDDIDNGGCPWWSMACSTGGIQSQVEEAAAHNGRMIVAGTNKPRREKGAPKSYDCAHENVCSWQKQATLAGRNLCPPRDALARGLDPRVCLF